MSEHCRAELRRIARKLEQWAAESEHGGWSTHQVQPMRDEAMRIFALLGRSQ
jgi:hypothetical protein